jgi:WD40 repeat protein
LLLVLLLLIFGGSSGPPTGSPPPPPPPPPDVHPLDRLRAENIPAGLLKALLPIPPDEVVAILGDRRPNPGGIINVLALSPDGKRLASCTDPHEIQICNARTLELERPIPLDGSVHALAFSPDGRMLVGGEPLRMWNVKTGKKEWIKPVGKDEDIRFVAFTADGKYLLTATDKGPPSVRGVDGGDVLRRFEIDGTASERMILIPHGKKDLAAVGNGGVYLLDAATGKAHKKWAVEPGEPRCASFNQDGKQIAIGYRGAVIVRDLAQGIVRRELPAGGVDGVLFLPGGRYLATTQNGQIVRWDIKTGESDSLVSFRLPPNQRVAPALTPDGGATLLYAHRNVPRLLDTATRKERLPTAPHAGAVHCVAFTPDGRRLLSADELGNVYCWDLATLKQVYRLDASFEPATATGWMSLALTKDGGQLALAGGNASLFDARTGAGLHEHLGIGGGCAGFTPDGKWLLLAATNGTVAVRVPAKPRLDKGQIGKDLGWFIVSPDGTHIVAGSGPKIKPGSISRWAVPDGKLISSWPHQPKLACACLSPDGHYLYTGQAPEDSLWIWDLHAKVPQPTPRETGHITVASMALSADGGRLVTAAGGDVVVWAVPKGERKLLLQQLGASETRQCLAFAPDGRHVAVGRRDGRILVLRLSKDDPPAQAER